jgi:dienelactone hydrolase
MLRFSFLLLMGLPLLAQAPAQDARNTNVPNTDTHFIAPEYKTLAEWEARRAKLRRQVLQAAGLLPMPEKTPLNPMIFGRLQRGDYSIEKVLLETMPGYYLAGNLYRPLKREGKLPAIASPHGHWVYGRLEHAELGSIPARAVNLARQGHIVFTYDMVGYNDTIQTPHAFGGQAEQLWAFGPLGLQTWNSIRVVDFLESLPEVDPARIAATGASGGGTQTFLLTAVDDRVKFSAPVNMVSGIMQGGSPCENAPNLRVGTSNIEIAALMAPRPMLLVSATGDWTRNVPKEEFPAIQKIYELYGKRENVEVVQFDAPHNYNKDSREAVYQFFGKRILGAAEGKGFEERNFQREKLQDMLVLSARTLPPNALSYAQVFAQWKRASERQFDQTSDLNAIRERLTAALLAEWPEDVVSSGDGERIVLNRKGTGERVPALWLPKQGGAVTVVVHPDGAEAGRKLAAGSPNSVLAIDAYQTGTAVAPRDNSHRHFLTFNQTDDAERVQDILTALAFVQKRKPASIELRGAGKAAVWSLFAAAVAPVKVKLTEQASAFAGTDEDFIRDYFVPGIQRAGGLKAARRLLAQ